MRVCNEGLSSNRNSEIENVKRELQIPLLDSDKVLLTMMDLQLKYGLEGNTLTIVGFLMMEVIVLLSETPLPKIWDFGVNQSH